MEYDLSNIFARIIRGEIPCNKVLETNFVLAFKDVNPKAPHHILVIPKGYYCNFHAFHETASPQEIQDFYQAITQIIHDLELHKTGYRLITNFGENGGQEVPHYHIHILGGKKIGALVAS